MLVVGEFFFGGRDKDKRGGGCLSGAVGNFIKLVEGLRRGVSRRRKRWICGRRGCKEVRLVRK